jgi:hypothetical protein
MGLGGGKAKSYVRVNALIVAMFSYLHNLKKIPKKCSVRLKLWFLILQQQMSQHEVIAENSHNLNCVVYRRRHRWSYHQRYLDFPKNEL